MNSSTPTPSKRLDSLDALRGFTMFWIVGGGALFFALAQRWDMDSLAQQMRHVKWEGFRFFDLLFPLFMFIAGVAIPLALRAQMQKGASKARIQWRTFRRMVILILLGLVFIGTFKNGFENGRIASVLAQIGIAYFFAATIVLHTETVRSRFIWLLGILVGIGILQTLVPVPGIGVSVLTPEASINAYIDKMLLPGRMFGGTFDPEGILCCISATGIVLMGALAGSLLSSTAHSEKKKLALLCAAGVGCILLALALAPVYPIIKSCWTSTFNLLTGGISMLMLALFYFVMDVLGWKKWAFPLQVIGMNSIFAYLFVRVVGTQRISEYFLGWLAKPMGAEGGKLLLLIGNILVLWLLLYYMFRKKIFLRV